VKKKTPMRVVLFDRELERVVGYLSPAEMGTAPEAFGAYIKAEIAKWSKLVKAAGVKPD
jgi:tripartite-type tricarboxylate transporter receptor subunit TctC